jgi:hypothetical protein
MAKIEISLSRLHKVAERLKNKATELMAEAISQAQAVHVAGSTGDAHIQRLTEQGAAAMTLSEQAERYLRIHGDVRAVIGRENQSRGINGLLAQQETVNRVVAHLKGILEHAKASGIAPAELSAYKPLNPDSRYSTGNITVVVVSAEQRTALEDRIKKLQREAFQLSDKVAEANAPRLTLELDDDIAAEVTGA